MKLAHLIQNFYFNMSFNVLIIYRLNINNFINDIDFDF